MADGAETLGAAPRRGRKLSSSPQQMTVRLRASAGSLGGKGGAEPKFVRVRVQRQRLLGKAVGILGTPRVKKPPRSLQKPERCSRRQTDDPETGCRSGAAARLSVLIG